MGHRAGELLADLPGVTTVKGDYYSAFPALTSTGDRAAITRCNTVEVYALPSGRLLRTIAHPMAVNAVAFAPAGHNLVSGAVDGSLLITRGDREPTALPTSPAGIDAMAIRADGRAVAADASDRLRVIDPDRSALLMDLTSPSRVRLLRPSPGGTRMITLSTRSTQAPPALWNPGFVNAQLLDSAGSPGERQRPWRAATALASGNGPGERRRPWRAAALASVLENRRR